MTTDENRLREELCRLGRSMFARGLTHGSTGNLSARLPDGYLMTPTGSSPQSVPASCPALPGELV